MNANGRRVREVTDVVRVIGTECTRLVRMYVNNMVLISRKKEIRAEWEVFALPRAIRGREHSLLWSRSGTRTKAPAGNSEADAQLVSRLKQKDEHAFLILYDRHHRSVYRFLLHMTESIAIAEELTQEVFVVILNAMCSGTVGQFNPEKGTLEGYLLGIARNFAREEHRRSRRLLSLNTALETPEWSEFLNKVCQDNRAWDASEVLAARSEMKTLHSAILDLPAHYREG